MAGFDPKKLRAEEEYGGFAVGATSDDSFLIEVLPEYPSIIKSGRAEEDLWANPEEPVVYEEELPLAPEDVMPIEKPQDILQQEPLADSQEDRIFFEEESQYNAMEQEEMAEPAEKDEFEDILKGYQIPPVQESSSYAPPPPQMETNDTDLDDDLMDLINQSLGGSKSKAVDKPIEETTPTVSKVVPPTPPTPVEKTPKKVVPPTPPTPVPEIAPTAQPQSYAEIMEQNLAPTMLAPDFEDEQENVFTFDGVIDADQPSKVSGKSAPSAKKQEPPIIQEQQKTEPPPKEEKPRKKRVIPMWLRIAAGLAIITLSTSGIGFSLYYTGLWEQWFGGGSAVSNANGQGAGTTGAVGTAGNEGGQNSAGMQPNAQPPASEQNAENNATVLPEDTMDIASFDAPSPVGSDSMAIANRSAEKQTLAESSPPPSTLERSNTSEQNKTLDKPRTPAARNELRPRTIKSTPKPKNTELAEQKIVPPRNARGLFVVQMYSSPSREDAEAWVARLRKKGVLNPHIQPQTVRNQTWYRVRFGTYATQDEAEKDAIAMGFADSWVVRLR